MKRLLSTVKNYLVIRAKSVLKIFGPLSGYGIAQRMASGLNPCTVKIKSTHFPVKIPRVANISPSFRYPNLIVF
tara:strand:+ start:230 stop:451 length:222 start_codon:yes stop_codon:yes gene_type:complete